MAPLISVIVPVYKAEDTLRNCVDSILKQTNRDFELLLIDDGSPDSCRDICDTYAAKDARVRVWYKENGGVSTARNLGLEVACGEWIAFVDADDSVDEGFFDVLKEGLGYDLVIGGTRLFRRGRYIIISRGLLRAIRWVTSSPGIYGMVMFGENSIKPRF